MHPIRQTAAALQVSPTRITPEAKTILLLKEAVLLIKNNSSNSGTSGKENAGSNKNNGSDKDNKGNSSKDNNKKDDNKNNSGSNGQNNNQKPEKHTHKYVETITKQATCTEDGEKLHKCACGKSYTTIIIATGISMIMAQLSRKRPVQRKARRLINVPTAAMLNLRISQRQVISLAKPLF
mgnify:CR=1 FL=1